MFIRVGDTTVAHPETGDPIHFKVLQALDPMFEIPVAQIAIPVGPQAVLIGDAIAGRGADTPTDGPKLIVPDFIAPEDMRPDDPK